MKNKKGPDFPDYSGRVKFFDFYKTHRSRALKGFLKNIRKNDNNRKVLANYLRDRKKINCLILGCSYGANPRDTSNFLRQFNKRLDVNLAVLDILPDALIDIPKFDVACLPIVAPAQNTPFLDNYFDVIVSDCLLTCCSFSQHEPIIRETSRIAKDGALIILGVVHSQKSMTFRMDERPIKNFCRTLDDYKSMFRKNGFEFSSLYSTETSLPGKWSHLKIENCIARKR